MTRRVVITGIGVRTPGGRGAKEFWDLISSGRTATSRRGFALRRRLVARPNGCTAAEPIDRRGRDHLKSKLFQEICARQQLTRPVPFTAQRASRA